MPDLKLSEDIYEKFKIEKTKSCSDGTDEEFIELLLIKYSESIDCIIENSNEEETEEIEHENKSDKSDNNLESIPSYREQENEPESTPGNPSPIYICPECKFSTVQLSEIHQHFTDTHEQLNGQFPCTCGVNFNRMSLFLSHYIQCPIAATDLLNQQSSLANGNNSTNHHHPMNDLDDLDDPESQINDHNNPHHNQFENFLIDDSYHDEDYQQLSKSPFSEHQTHQKSPNSPEQTGDDSNGNNSTSGHKLYECNHCDKSFKSKGLLDQHKHLHFPPRHECEWCGRKFRWPPQFYTHKQQCTKRKQAILKDSLMSANLLCGLSTDQLLLGINGKSDLTNGNGSPGTNQCICGFKTNQTSTFFEHKQTCLESAARLLILQNLMDAKPTNPPSNIMTRSSSSKEAQQTETHLQKMMQNFLGKPSSISTVNPPVNKQQVPMTLSSSNPQNPVVTSPPTNVVRNRLSPIRPHHKSCTGPNHDDKPFECDFCGSRFMTKISLKQHIDGKHSDQARYNCDKCGKGYYWNASFNYHKKKCSGDNSFRLNTSGLLGSVVANNIATVASTNFQPITSFGAIKSKHCKR